MPVILTSTMAAPDREYEGYDAVYSLPAKLHAGVKLAIAGGSGALYSNRLPWDAGVSVAFGLPEEEALKAVTINAAEMMGIADKVGSLEVGKQGTLLGPSLASADASSSTNAGAGATSHRRGDPPGEFLSGYDQPIEQASRFRPRRSQYTNELAPRKTRA